MTQTSNTDRDYSLPSTPTMEQDFHFVEADKLQRQQAQKKLSLSPITSSSTTKDHRRRRSSSIISHVEPESADVKNDQEVLPNLNATWVHSKGAWIIHFVIIILLKIFYDLFPVFNNEQSWTMTNLTYVVGSYIMFHQIKGTPFEFNSGAYDNLTMWEQIDNGDQYTPAKKFLMGVPIALFLLATHYSRFDLQLFVLNFVLCLVAVVPKLAMSHRLRVSIPFISESQLIN